MSFFSCVRTSRHRSVEHNPDRYSYSYRYGPSRRKPSTFSPSEEADTARSPLLLDASEGELENVTQVTSINVRSLENAKAHHTKKFDQVHKGEGDLIIRRGQPFDITVTFNRPYDASRDEMRLVFQTGVRPIPGNGTYVRFILSARDYPKHWGAAITKVDGEEVSLRIYTPPDCIVAEWEMMVASMVKTGGKWHDYSYQYPESIYILFNPWCRDDLVYFHNQELLKEYVLNDSGVIFRGNYRQIGAKPWFFGQFEDGILEAALYCIQKGFNFQTGPAMGDPVRVSRVISKIVNSQDDKGVLVGNWSGKYTGGMSPVAWSGSVMILKWFMRNKNPVKFGQCFVFSGLVTTICRAVGIPCRSVTNFASAHDSDCSCSIDEYWEITDDEERALDEYNCDSVWNFHVWNDAWMKRVDLPLGYSGWQAIDATPQEASEGIFQCGPASLHAIKSGNCEFPYETPFIFAEVGADRVHWARMGNKDWKVLGLEKAAVGKFLSTKKPDGKGVTSSLTDCESIREDITEQYKYDDDSERERIAVICACRAASSKKPVYRSEKQDIKFGFRQLDYIMIGMGFDAVLTLENESQETRTVKGKIRCDSVQYTGTSAGKIKESQFRITLPPGKGGEAVMKVSPYDYLDKLTEQATTKIVVIARVVETDQVQAFQDDFRLRRPDLDVEIKTKQARVGEPFECKVSLKNPLPKPLTKCFLSVEGPGLDEPMDIPQSDVPSGREWSTTVTLKPKKPVSRQVLLSFKCKELSDINGVAEIVVLK